MIIKIWRVNNKIQDPSLNFLLKIMKLGIHIEEETVLEEQVINRQQLGSGRSSELQGI